MSLARLLVACPLCLLWAGFEHAPVQARAAQTPAPASTPAPAPACATNPEPATPDTLAPDLKEAWKLAYASDPAAIPCFSRLVPAAEQFGTPLQRAHASHGLGWSLSKLSRWKDARPYYRRALEMYRETGDASNEARMLRELGRAAKLGDEDDAGARDLWSQALAIYTERNDAREIAITVENLVHVTEEGGEKDALRERGLAAARDGKSMTSACGILHEWGDGLFSEGRYVEAVSRLTEALACVQREGDRARMGRVLLSLGRVQRAHGQLRAALRYYQRALELQTPVPADDPRADILTLNALAVTYSRLNEPQEALAHYQEALARAQARHLEDQVGFLSGQLGGFYAADRGQCELAIPLLERAVSLERSPDRLAYRFVNLARCLVQLGRLDDAHAAADRAVTMAQAQSVDARLPALRMRATVRMQLGRLPEAQADIDTALALVESLRAHTIPTDFMKRGFASEHQELFAFSIDLLERQHRDLDALEVAEQARARAFQDLLASRTPEHGGAAPATSAVASADADVSPSTPGTRSALTTARPVVEEPATRGRQIALTTRGATSAVIEDLEDRGTNAVESGQTVPPATVADIRATARRLRSTLVVYWVGDAATYAWVISPAGDIHGARLDVSAVRLREMVAAASAAVESASAGLGLGGATTRPWNDLHRVLIAPIRGFLPSSPNSVLTIVPHGPLFQVAFAALRDEQGVYLLERYRLHYTPAVGVLRFTAARAVDDGDRAAASSAPMLLVGDPVLAARTGNEDPMPPLPWARREVTEIGRLLAPARAEILTADAARESAVRAHIERAGLLHFATHGIVQQDESLASFLALSTSPDAGDSGAKPRVMSTSTSSPSTSSATNMAVRVDSTDDGQLTADEVYGLHLQARLVVLSACRTALGPLTGDGVIGFTRAFLYAGASSVVATSWDVPDEAGYEVMRRFYQARATAASGRSGATSRNAANGGRAAVARTAPTADALRTAQLAVLASLRKGTFTVTTPAGRIPLREHPLLWAGFLIVGEP